MLSGSLDQHNPVCGGRAWGRPQAPLVTTAYRLGSPLKCARPRVVPALLEASRNAAQIQRSRRGSLGASLLESFEQGDVHIAKYSAGEQQGIEEKGREQCLTNHIPH
jgi:hypothetical protein